MRYIRMLSYQKSSCFLEKKNKVIILEYFLFEKFMLSLSNLLLNFRIFRHTSIIKGLENYLSKHKTSLYGIQKVTL